MMDWTVMNYMTLTNDDKSMEQDPAKIVCRTQIGDKYNSTVSQYADDVDIASGDELFKTNSTGLSAELDWEDTFFTASPDFDKFETESDGETAWAKCTVELVLNDRNSDTVGALFGQIYNVEYGVKLFDADDLNPITVTQGEFKIQLPEPEYDQSWTDEPEAPLAEEYFSVATEELVDSTGVALTNAAGEALGDFDAFQAFEIEFILEDDYDMDDILKITFITDAPADILTDQAVVVQWGQFRHSLDLNGDYQKVQCKSIVGGTIDDVVIDTFIGATEIKDAEVAYTGLDAIQTDEKLAGDEDDAYFNSGDEQDYENRDSDISGNKFITCTAELALSKIGRDYGMFGEYDVIMGTRVYTTSADTDFASLGEHVSSYYLDEPEYDSGDETTEGDYSDYYYFGLDDKTWDIDVEEDLGFEGRGEQRMFTELIVSPAFSDDDILRVYMEIELPEDVLKNGTIVYQYMQLLGENDMEGQDPYMSVGCQVTVGDVESRKVENFYGVDKMDVTDDQVAGKIVSESSADDKEKNRNDGSFKNTEQDWDYESYEIGNGNKVQACAVEMPIEKGQNRDENIFQTWSVIKGARIYTDDEDDAPKQIGEKKTDFKLEEPDYVNDLIDQDTLDYFEQDAAAVWEEDYVKTEISFQGSQEATIDAAAALGADADAKAEQHFYAAYESNVVIDKPDNVAFVFEMDLPEANLPDGAIIMQIVSLTPKSDPDADAITIGCAVQVGNPDATKVYEWNGTGSMDYATTGTSKFDAINEDEKVEDSEVTKIDDDDFYALKDSTLGFENKVQNCQAILPVEKQGGDSEIFTEYTAKLSAKIYADKDDIEPINVTETTFEITLEAPVYEAEEWDINDETWMEEIENEFNILHEEESTMDLQLSTGEWSFAKQYLWIDTWVNKEYTRPDVLDFSFNAEGPSEKLVEGKIIWSYASFHLTSDTSGEKQTVACQTEIGNSDNFYIYNWKGTSAFDENTVTGQMVDAISTADKTDADDVDNFRQSYNDWDYESWTWADEDQGTSTTWSSCKASLDLPKIGRDTAKFGEYTVVAGYRIYDADMTTFEDIINERTFTFELVEPSYEFGDDFEFDEGVSEDSVFKESSLLDLADFVAPFWAEDISGKGFQKVAGAFKVVPNFDTTLWMFKFSLEMPFEYFNADNYLFQWASFQDTAESMDKVTVSCGLTMGDYENVDIIEYDNTFDSTVQTDLPAWETNYEAFAEYSAYMRSWDTEEYMLQDISNDKVRQSCIVQIEIPPSEAADLFNTDYTVTIGGRIYEDRDSAVHEELPAMTFTYFIPAADFALEEYDDTVKDKQIVAEENFEYDSETIFGVEGDVTQYLSAGFEVNPYDENANDWLGFQFEIEAPADALKEGKIVFQWATYVKSDDFSSDPISIGCTTKIGDPYVSEVKTYQGTSTLNTDSTTVAGKTYKQQNNEDKAAKKDSFNLIQDLEWYDKYDLDDGIQVQPCVAVIEYDGKLNDTNPIIGTYNVTIGSRIYADEDDVEPLSLPEQSFQIEFTLPESDLSVLYEEDVEEDKQSTVIYLDDKFRFKVDDYFPDLNLGGKFWMRVQGGYKLYGTSDAEDRWFFNFAIEAPSSLFVDDQIIYMWLKYADSAMTDANTGAVACKVAVNDISKTSVDQWIGETNMSSESEGIVGKLWKNQNKEGKMATADYNALYYNEDIFLLKDSNRTSVSNYSIQQCEVEVRLDDSVDVETLTYDMQFGMRFYENNDALTFTTTAEPEFDWYRSDLTFSAEYNEVVNFVDKQVSEEKELKESYTFTATDVFADKIVVWEAQQAEEAAAAAEIAEQEAAAAAALEAEADAAAENEANASVSNMVTSRGRQEEVETSYVASQSYVNGFTSYEQTVASDWWYWTLQLDATDGLFVDGQVFYQWVTLVDQADGSAFTIGCKLAKGSDAQHVDYFTLDSDATDALHPESALVVDIAWGAQAPELLEDDLDHKWIADSTHSPDADESTTEGNTNFACYLAMEIPKIGRNPADFNKTYDISMGARIYADDDATTFDTIPTATGTIIYTEPDSYVVAEEKVAGAFALFASSMATIAVLIMAF